jgi:hypothetical protein
MTVTERFKNFPPILVRLLARKDYQPLSSGYIAAMSGLGIPQVEFISQQTDWKEVRLPDAFDFLRGCGLAIDDAAAWRRAMDYLSKRPTFRYLRAHDQWESYFEPMLKRWLGAYFVVPGYLCPPVRSLIQRLKPAVNRGVGAECQKV